VSFFEPPPPPEPPDEGFERKPWFGAPRNELGVSTGLRLALARTDEVAVALVDVVAFTTGVSLNLVALRRAPAEPGSFDHPFGHFWPQGSELPPELLRFGVEFSDGGKATTLGASPATWAAEGEPPGPILLPGGGSGSDDYWESSFWLWPLPPPGPLAFVVEWPAEGIDLTRHEVDTEPIIEASRRSETLWPEGPRRGGGVSRRDY
jgi:hypothetical protein